MMKRRKINFGLDVPPQNGKKFRLDPGGFPLVACGKFFYVASEFIDSWRAEKGCFSALRLRADLP
jgi:hypothetical protein